MPWLWACPQQQQQQQQQQQWTLSLVRTCRPRGGPARVIVPFYSALDSQDGQGQGQEQNKLFTVHSFDLHISPPLHLRDLWQSLGVRP
jgi:hypothetical protein